MRDISTDLKGILISFFVVNLLFCVPALANYSPASLDAFLAEQTMLTYDCPKPSSLEQTESYVSHIENYSAQQQLHLNLLYAHHLICVGRSQTAEETLRSQLQAPSVDKASETYARATYVLGLALDFQEKNERCDWYLRARELSEKTIPDVNVSSRLGLITYCSNHLPVFELLEKSYEVLEDYSNSKNSGLLAHIHNAIGLLYGYHDMYFLAAEQYLKAHELGLDVYTGSNRVSALVSAIVALSESGQFDNVLNLLEEYKRLNADVNTPITRVFYLFQLANYYSATSDFEPMRDVLVQWEELLPELANRRYKVYHALYTAILCEYDKDISCVTDFIASIEDPELPEMHILKGNGRYKKLLVRAYLLLGEKEKARLAFDDYLALENLNAESTEKHDIAVQVSQLRAKIQTLQRRIEEDRRTQFPLWVTIGLFVFLLITAGFIFKKQSKQLSEYDPITRLLTPDAIMNRISKLESPAEGKNHALVIFDLKNFREVNLAMGMTKGDVILKRVAETLKSVTRDNDLVGRMSTEQFIICLTNISEEHCNAFVNRTKVELGIKFFVNQEDKSIRLNSTFSVYMTSDKLEDLDTILKEMLTSVGEDV